MSIWELIITQFDDLNVRRSSIIVMRLLLFSVFFPVNAAAQGDLLVTPRRVVFDGTQRIHELHLVNTGNDSSAYTISFHELRMTDKGGFEQISEPDPGQLLASNNIRIFPRRITLAPKESQIIKLQLFRTNQLETGEYRSHLYFRPDPKKNGARGLEEKKEQTEGITMEIVPVVGISIPVIIRRGALTAEVRLSQLELMKNNAPEPVLQMTFIRDGNRSVYGDVTVEHISQNGAVTGVASVKGVAVYTPNKVRHLQLPLDKNPAVDYGSGRLRVVYEKKGDAGKDTIAEAELLLPSL